MSKIINSLVKFSGKTTSDLFISESKKGFILFFSVLVYEDKHKNRFKEDFFTVSIKGNSKEHLESISEKILSSETVKAEGYFFISDKTTSIVVKEEDLFLYKPSLLTNNENASYTSHNVTGTVFTKPIINKQLGFLFSYFYIRVVSDHPPFKHDIYSIILISPSESIREIEKNSKINVTGRLTTDVNNNNSLHTITTEEEIFIY